MLYYLWNMKPGETGKPNEKVIQHNTTHIPDHQMLGPEDILPLVSRFSEELSEAWEKIPHWIIQCDLGRLLYIYYHGGIYMDCDCVIRKPIPSHPVVLFTERVVPHYQLGPREKKYNLRVANYAFASEAKHPFLKDVLLECIRRLKLLKGNVSTTDILWVCGPDVITTVYHETRYKDITLLDATYLNHFMAGSWR